MFGTIQVIKQTTFKKSEQQLLLKRKDEVVFREEPIGGFPGAHNELLLSSVYTTLWFMVILWFTYFSLYMFSIYISHQKRKGKKLGLKIASCLMSNQERGVRIGGRRIQRKADVIRCHQHPPKGEQNNKNNFCYLATCFSLFTRLILNAAIPILLVM